MKRLTLLVAVGLIVFTSFAFHPTAVHADACTTLSGSGNRNARSGSIDVSAGDTIVATITPQKTSTFATAAIGIGSTALASRTGIGKQSVTYTAPFSGPVNGIFSDTDFSFRGRNENFSWTITVQSNGCTSSDTQAGYFGPLFWDGRLNDKDGAETAALFCDNGILVVYGLGNPWTIVLKVSPNEMDRVPGMPKQNTLIKQNGAYRLYRLTTGELQINAPGLDTKNDYWFTFNDCPRNENKDQ